MSVDPLVSMTHEAYGYGNNNPISFSDPTGLCSTVVNGELYWGGGTHVSLDGSGTSELVDIDPGSGGQQGRVFRDSARAVTKVTWMDVRSGPKGDFTDAWRRVNDSSYDPHDTPFPMIGVDAGCWFAACLQFGVDANGLWLNFGAGLGLSSPGIIAQTGTNSASPQQSTEFSANASVLIGGAAVTYRFGDGENKAGLSKSFGISLSASNDLDVGKASFGASLMHWWRFG